MPTLRLLTGCLLALSLTGTGRADPPKKIDPPKQAEPPEHQSPSRKKSEYTGLLLGKWSRTDNYVGTTMEYDKNGTYLSKGITTRKTQPNGMKGTWKLDGDRLIQTLGPYRTNTTVTIKTLTETHFVFINHAGQEVTYERVKDDLKEKPRKK